MSVFIWPRIESCLRWIRKDYAGYSTLASYLHYKSTMMTWIIDEAVAIESQDERIGEYLFYYERVRAKWFNIDGMTVGTRCGENLSDLTREEKSYVYKYEIKNSLKSKKKFSDLVLFSGCLVLPVK